jgi:peptidoglycan/LPS O-acetylase OafA/YrhL
VDGQPPAGAGLGADSSWHYAGNGVSWSLACEAAFYLALPLILYALRGRTVGRRLLLAGGWYLLTAVATVLLVQQGPAFENAAYVNPVLRSGEFVLGVAAGLAVRDGWRPRLPLPAVLVGGLVALAACRSRSTASPSWDRFSPPCGSPSRCAPRSATCSRRRVAGGSGAGAPGHGVVRLLPRARARAADRAVVPGL